MPEEPLNIILVVLDTLRYDHLGCNGNERVHTPNLDQFAGRGVVFDRAYQASFPTIPTRTDMMTGRLTFPFRGWTPLPDDETILSELLGEAGYTSMLICDTPHLIRDGHRFDRGFTAWEWIRGQEGDRSITDAIDVPLPGDAEKIRTAERMRNYHYRHREAHWRTERDTFVARTMTTAMDWLELNYTHDRFFLWIDAFDPHEPWDPPQFYVDLYDPGYEGQVIDHPEYDYCDYLTEAELEHCRALYAGEVTLVDTWVGQLLRKIERLGLEENTAVIITSDHGHYIGDHGRIGKSGSGPDGPWPFYEAVSHLVLMSKLPEGAGGVCGERTSTLIQPTDIFPTVLELAGIDSPHAVDGRSFVPHLQGAGERLREVAVTSRNLPSSPGRGVSTAVTDGRWTLHYRGPDHPAELYNIEEDPGEQVDRYARDFEEARRLHREHLRVLADAGCAEERIALRSELP